jgi:hypothetical protein
MGPGIRLRHRKETAMKASLRIAALALSVAGLAACAGTQETSAYVAPGVVGSYPTDNGYVSSVERIARRQGIQVTWVNVPVKHVKGEQDL